MLIYTILPEMSKVNDEKYMQLAAIVRVFHKSEFLDLFIQHLFHRVQLFVLLLFR